MAERDFADHARKTGTFVSGGPGESEIVVDDHDVFFRPAELVRPAIQVVLARSGLAIVLHLRKGGLANVDEGLPRGVRRFHFEEISHWQPPPALSLELLFRL
jgi:hypothetical protein